MKEGKITLPSGTRITQVFGKADEKLPILDKPGTRKKSLSLYLAFMLLIPLLLLIDLLCYQIALPVGIDIQPKHSILTVGSTQLALGNIAQPLALQFAPHDPLVHEYQLDGSDSTNNLDLDTTYLSQIASSPYYRLQAWMRDLDGTSRWRNLTISANGRAITSTVWPSNGTQVTLPNASNIHISVQLQRPETPMSLNLVLNNGSTLQIMLDRNNRRLTVTNLTTAQKVASTFFPLDPAPFAAMLVDTFVRIVLWALIVLLVVQFGEIGTGLVCAIWYKIREWYTNGWEQQNRQRRRLAPSLHSEELEGTKRRWQFPVFQAVHPIALIALGGSLVYVLWIAVVQYQGQAHIYDASAYLFAAKMYASGHLSVPVPHASELFPGPFMVSFAGRWFGQYDPGTSLTLVPGIWLGVPWLVEPLLGTLALLGIGLIAARLYNRHVATLSVLLGCLSPFYSYLAASYLSHAVMLFYLVWGLWALLRFRQGAAGWNMLLCGLCFGMAALTRDQVALLYIAILLPGALVVTWERGKKYKRYSRRRLLWWLAFAAVALVFLGLYLGFNRLLTGSTTTTPRTLFFAGDKWGFGQDIGFYGQHTLAAGLVNMDELLTILQIDLFGWPFYLMLVFIALPFLTGRAKKADWFLLLALVLTAGSYIGYFYHGIYLGPRYLFEDLPFLLILSARGVLILGIWGLQSGQAAHNWLRTKIGRSTRATPPAISLVTLALVSTLILCNLLYYLPRQNTRYQNYTSLPSGYKLNNSQVYHPPVHHAIVISNDYALYQLVLFSLNDPELTGDVIYAWGNTSSQFQQLRHDFPGRVLYQLVVNADGSVRYVEINQ